MGCLWRRAEGRCDAYCAHGSPFHTHSLSAEASEVAQWKPNRGGESRQRCTRGDRQVCVCSGGKRARTRGSVNRVMGGVASKGTCLLSFTAARIQPVKVSQYSVADSARRDFNLVASSRARTALLAVASRPGACTTMSVSSARRSNKRMAPVDAPAHVVCTRCLSPG